MDDEVYLKTYKTLESAEFGIRGRWIKPAVLRRVWVGGGIFGLAAISAGLWFGMKRFDAVPITHTDQAVTRLLPGEMAFRRNARLVTWITAPTPVGNRFSPATEAIPEVDHAAVKGVAAAKPSVHARTFDASRLPPPVARRILVRTAKLVEAPRPPDVAPVPVPETSSAVLDRYLTAVPTAAPATRRL